ncbi:hypothetical protein B0J12DRAFT_700256 [Macrophomina phaseolina]|uniref:Uncharacterized protein n=1 Tax=Macrophomina phaseolina TaxID=35725 RepID=A0ABQ8G8R9_9PEZI|nr:hypothetical protein B0J12DRAFT_700256 [Macrophomina phaseolina]
MAPTGPPMKWDTESDMKVSANSILCVQLFGLVLNLYDIKCSVSIARASPPAPFTFQTLTPSSPAPKSQSIYHRLHAIRKKVTGILDDEGGKATLAAASPLTPRGPKPGGGGSRRSTGKRSTARSKRVKDESDSDDDDHEYILFGSPSAKRESVRTAGRKRSYQEPDTDDDDDDDDDEEEDQDVEQEVSPAAKKANVGFKEEGGAADAAPEENGNGEDNGGDEIAQAKAFFGIGELDDTETDPEEV